MHKIFFILLCCLAIASQAADAMSLPKGFVYLKNIDPTIIQEMRYAGDHNFIGRPVQGYHAAECILTLPAAEALHQVQIELKKSALSLKVYDCYRPQRAVNDFIAWSKISAQQEMKAEFYPRVNKADFFKLGYVAEKSGHTRGSTVDLSLVRLPVEASATYHPGQAVACYETRDKRFHDNSIEMGTGYDCMDELAHPDSTGVNAIAYHNRQALRAIMEKHGFQAYQYEWWHFTLKQEPYPNTYFHLNVDRN